jgi:DNA invertase Pin-like site-specific DNA recombinase
MADAAEGKFDVVLVYHTSRFARNQVEARRYKQLLRERLGIRVISVTQPMGDDPNDPSAFLAESIHEMFDEYCSVSLSFWTRSGLREKARQDTLSEPLPWGYMRDLATKLAVPDPERAPLVLQLFERYATGQESDLTLASWLNATGARTARNRPFGKDTVREMLCNTAYAGYVSGLRDKTRTSSGTSPRPNTSCADRHLRKNCSASDPQPSRPSTEPKRSSMTSPASGTWRPSPPSDASSYSPYSDRYGRRTERSSPCSHTTPSCPTSKPHNRAPNATQDRVVPKAGATGVGSGLCPPRTGRSRCGPNRRRARVRSVDAVASCRGAALRHSARDRA